jgi:uncharacterized RDD family membrane protein YckC
MSETSIPNSDGTNHLPPPINTPPPFSPQTNANQNSSFTAPPEKKDFLISLNPENYVLPVSGGIRFVNLLLDGIFLGILGQIIQIPLRFLGMNPSNNVLSEYQELIKGNLVAFAAGAIFIMMFINMMIKVVYYFMMEHNTGASLGKMITGTKVVHESGRKATSKEVLIRTFCRLIPFNAFSVLFGNGIGWHDKISKTRIIDKRNYDQIMQITMNQ